MNKMTEFKEILSIFFPKDFSERYSYLGYTYIPYKEGTYPHEVVRNVIKSIDRTVKPKWCPRWFLRFLQRYGNDNSVVRVRNRTLHNLHKKLTDGIFITDIKTKWSPDDIRIYGYFTNDIQSTIDLAEEYIYQYYKNEKESN